MKYCKMHAMCRLSMHPISYDQNVIPVHLKNMNKDDYTKKPNPNPSMNANFDIRTDKVFI